MRRYALPYHFARPPRRLQRARMDNIALVPASMLFHKAKYKAVANRLTTDSVLIVPPYQSRQREILKSVASYFRSSGHQVTTIPIDLIMHNRIAIS